MPGFMPGIHVFDVASQARRGWPGQARPDEKPDGSHTTRCQAFRSSTLNRQVRLSPVSRPRLSFACPVHEGRFARRSEVEQSLRTGRNGASPKPTDTASCARASQAQAREVLGHRPAPLRGSATSWLDAVQVKAKKFAGWRAVSRRAPASGSAVPKPKTAVMERRKAFPRPLVSGDPEIMLRHNDQGAPLGAPSPLLSRGED